MLFFLYIFKYMSSSSEINDIREPKDFKGISFSKFKKCDVRSELIKSLQNSKIEPACYWSAELICAGHYAELWEIILLFYSKYIHIGNPKFAVYLDIKIQTFKNIIKNGYTNNELRMRNSDKIRKLFCEIMCIICESKKRHSFDSIQIKPNEFDLINLTDRLKAPAMTYLENIFRKEDPKELFIALNELSYNLHEDVKNSVAACYWIEWVIEFEMACEKRNEKCVCDRRSEMPVDSKYQKDVIWLIWCILIEVSSKSSPFISKVIKSLLQLFCLRYNKPCCRKRKNILYFAVEMLTCRVSLNEDIVKNKEKVANIVSQIDYIYTQIKEHEESPNTDYLFKNGTGNNLEKTIHKLEQMRNFENDFIPRI